MSTPSVSEEWNLDTDFVKALSEYDKQAERDRKLVHLLDSLLTSKVPVIAIVPSGTPATPVITLIYNLCEVAKVRIQPTTRKPTGN